MRGERPLGATVGGSGGRAYKSSIPGPRGDPGLSSGYLFWFHSAGHERSLRLEKRSSDYCPLSYDPIERGMQGRYLSVLRPTSGHRE